MTRRFASTRAGRRLSTDGHRRCSQARGRRRASPRSRSGRRRVAPSRRTRRTAPERRDDRLAHRVARPGAVVPPDDVARTYTVFGSPPVGLDAVDEVDPVARCASVGVDALDGLDEAAAVTCVDVGRPAKRLHHGQPDGTDAVTIALRRGPASPIAWPRPHHRTRRSQPARQRGERASTRRVASVRSTVQSRTGSRRLRAWPRCVPMHGRTSVDGACQPPAVEPERCVGLGADPRIVVRLYLVAVAAVRDEAERRWAARIR